MNKKDVQQRVIQFGKKLSLNKFSWDKKTLTFFSKEDNLVIDFNGVDNVTIISGNNSTQTAGNNSTQTAGWYSTQTAGNNSTQKASYDSTQTAGDNSTQTAGWYSTQTAGWCSTQTAGNNSTQKASYDSTQKAGNNSTQTAGWYSTQKAGNNSTQTAGWYSTQTAGGYSTQIRQYGIHQVLISEEGRIIQWCPENIPGYISKEKDDTCFYLNGDKNLGEHIIADGILSKVVSKKETQDFTIYKVVNHGEKEESYLVKEGDIYSHGETFEQAKKDLVFKRSKKDLSEYKDLKLNSVLSFDEAVLMYRSICNACEKGIKYFLSSNNIEEKEYTVAEILDKTKGQYNYNLLAKFFGGK